MGTVSRARRAARRVRPEILYAYAFPASARAVARVDPGYVLVEADEDVLREMRAAFPRELRKRKHRILRDRLAVPGERCWVITDAGGTAYGYCHVALEDHLNTRINDLVTVGAAQAYFFDDYVFTAHRGKGAHAASIARRLEIVAGLGVTEGLTTISSKNRPSIASYGKFGLRTTHVLVHLPLFHRTLRLRRP